MKIYSNEIQPITFADLVTKNLTDTGTLHEALGLLIVALTSVRDRIRLFQRMQSYMMSMVLNAKLCTQFLGNSISIKIICCIDSE